MNISNPILVIGLIAGSLLAFAGLFRPFLGLIVLVFIHFIQPGEFVPFLNRIHVERFYSIAILIAFLLYRLSQTRSLFSNKVVIASVCLIGAASLSVPFSIWKGGALWTTTDLIKDVIILVLIAGLIDTERKLYTILWILVILLTWFAGSGMISYLHGAISYQEGIDRAQGINSMAGGPNELAGLILALIPFLVSLIRCNRNILVRILLLGCGGLSLATLVITGARASMVALVIVGAYYILRSRHRIVTAVLCGILAGCIWFGMPQDFRDRYLTVGKYASGAQLDASNELRLHIWQVGLQMFVDHPILGVGAGQFPTAYGTIYATRQHQAWMDPHNLLIQVACEWGIVGLIFFSYFVYQIFSQIRAISHEKSGMPNDLNFQVASACGAMLLGLVVISFVSHTLYRPYWYILGGLVAANYMVTQASRERNAAEQAEDVEVPQKDTLDIEPGWAGSLDVPRT